MLHGHLVWSFLVNPAGVDIPPGTPVVSSAYTVRIYSVLC